MQISFWKTPVIFCLALGYFMPMGHASPGSDIDSLRSFIADAAEDTVKVKAMLSLSQEYFGIYPDKAIEVARDAASLSKKIHYGEGLGYGLKNEGIALYFQGNYVGALTIWQRSLKVFDSIDNHLGVANIQSNIGAIYYNEGDYSTALDHYLKSLKVSEEIKDTLRIVTALLNIGAVYNDKPATHEKALEYSGRALALAEMINDADAIATSSINIGEVYLEREDYAKAGEYFAKAKQVMEGTDGVIYAQIKLGSVYANMGKYDEALASISEALELARELHAKPNESHATIALAQTYQFMQDYPKALMAFKEAAKLARDVNAIKDLEQAYLGLENIYSQREAYDSAYKYQQLYMAVRKEVYDVETEKLLSNQMFNFQIEKKQNEINLLKKDQDLQELAIRKQKVINSLVGAGMLSVAVFLLVVLSQKKKISREKDRSENLLLNILPFEIAEELKEKGESAARYFDDATVLFTDFKGFTGLSQELSASELVEEINHYFKKFDEIVTKYKVEKIKTIGDAYMAVGGLPVPTPESVRNVVMTAIEMQDFVIQRQASQESRYCKLFNMRLGIHTGPVVAGIVGVKKFQYDVWGDTVNTAARMESSGEINKVNISEATYEILKHLDEFKFEYRGMVAAKGKGKMKMYFVSLNKPQNAVSQEHGRAKAEV